MPISDPEPASTNGRSRKWRNRLLKIVRRIHLYTGLLLLPWVILFGFSGMLFNHPEFGAMEVLRRVDSGAPVVDPEAVADSIVAALNASEGSPGYQRVAGNEAAIEGVISLQGPGKDGSVTVSVDPADGSARLTRVKESRPAAKVAPSLAPDQVPAAVSPDDLRAFAGDFAQFSGLENSEMLEIATRGGAELRFRVENPESGQTWNLSWNLMGGPLGSRELKSGTGPDLYTVLTRFHKTHHYPERFGTRWLWSAFGDLTGITMVFWGLSGMIMWWQIKPTRLIGVAGLSIAAVLALIIFSGTYSNLHWAPRESGRPPGGEGRPRSVDAPGAKEAPAPTATPRNS